MFARGCFFYSGVITLTALEMISVTPCARGERERERERERDRDRDRDRERDAVYFSFHEARETADAIIMDLYTASALRKKNEVKQKQLYACV